MNVSDDQLRNTRAWAAARIGQLSAAEVIVVACDEALAARHHECRHCYGTGFRMTHPAGVREPCFSCQPIANRQSTP